MMELFIILGAILAGAPAICRYYGKVADKENASAEASRERTKAMLAKVEELKKSGGQ